MKNQWTIKRVTSKFCYEILDWFTATRYFNEDSFVSRLRYFQITAFSFLFITSFLNFLGNLGFNYIVTSTTCLGLILVRYLIDCDRVKEAYVFLILFINLALIVLTYSGGLSSGVFLFFFPSIISFSFLADPSNKKNIAFTYIVGAGSFLLSVIIAPDRQILSQITQVTVDLNRSNFFTNILLSFLLIIWMSYNLAKENYRKQTILKNKEVFLDTIFNSSLHTEIIVDITNGKISNCNQHANSLFAVSANKCLTGQAVNDLFFETNRQGNEDFANELYNPFSNWEGEQTCVRLDGTKFPASVRSVSFKYHEKYYKKITIVDITEKNQILYELQEAKKKAEENASTKSQFLSHMSHELRTPLNGIIGAANLLLLDKILPQQKDQLSILKYSSEHMLSLINDILDLSKLEADKIELEKTEVDITELITKISSPFVPQFEAKGLKFEIKVDAKLKTSVLADPTRLNQILTNLLSNSLKFTNSGTVTLEVQSILIRSDYYTMEFSVKDTGIGINQDKIENIFEQFTQADLKTTRKYGGTGLGLTISRNLVGLMGGELKVESKYSAGSKFYFELTLPVHYSQKRIKISDEKMIATEMKLKGVKILIAEDNPVNMKIAVKFLDKWGVTYKTAKNGIEAIQLFENNKFDLVLMDLEMPEMDGYGAINAIRNLNASIPAIAFTAAVFDNMKESLIGSGFNDFVQKPFKPLDLEAKLIAFTTEMSKSA